MKSFLIGLSVSLIASPALALQAFKDVSGAVYITGLQPNQSIKVDYGDLKTYKPQKMSVDRCGVAVIPSIIKRFEIRNSQTKATLASVDTNYQGQMFILNWVEWVGTPNGDEYLGGENYKPQCNADNTINPRWIPYLSDLGNGLKGIRYWNGQGNISTYITGITNPTTIEFIDLDGATTKAPTRSRKSNVCGIAILTNTSRFPSNRLGQFKVDGLPFDAATLTTQKPPLCKNGILYQPLN